ncbi:MAG: DUF3500 domain-containing protein, partial [Chthonomonadales bacterium]
MSIEKKVCPDCAEPVSRREFLQSAATVAVATAAAISAPRVFAQPRIAPLTADTPESLVKTLYNTLTESQKSAVVLPWEASKRTLVNANWAIVEPAIGKTFKDDQKDLIRAILKGVTNEEWYPKFEQQMQSDSGGFENYHVAIFGDPNKGKSEWVMTGRHMTIRAGGDPSENMAFGGPIFYGHAPEENEKPSHAGNVFWFQAKRANECFQMLDGKQRDKALIALAPEESAIKFRKNQTEVPGIAIGDLTKDQKAHVELVMHDILAPYRKKDVQEVMRDVKANGGLDALHLSFYKQDDLGMDGVWDIWRLEGPAFVWHFRGAPHVHTWVNIGSKPA